MLFSAILGMEVASVEQVDVILDNFLIGLLPVGQEAELSRVS